MEKHEYGIQFKIGDKYSDNHPLTARLKVLESIARKAIRNPKVQSVCIYNCAGIAVRYFKKTTQGLLIEMRTPNSRLTK